MLGAHPGPDEPLWSQDSGKLAVCLITQCCPELTQQGWLLLALLHPQAAIAGAVYRKAMRLSPAGRRDVGQVVNLMSVDATTVFHVVPQLNMLYINPIRVIVALVLLFRAGTVSRWQTHNRIDRIVCVCVHSHSA